MTNIETPGGKETVSRRNLLMMVGGAVGALALGTGREAWNLFKDRGLETPDPIDVRSFCDAFPKTIQGAGKIVPPSYIPGSTRVLVHLGQSHEPPDLNKVTPEEHLEAQRRQHACQNELMAILRSLNENPDLQKFGSFKNVQLEGLIEPMLPVDRTKLAEDIRILDSEEKNLTELLDKADRLFKEGKSEAKEIRESAMKLLIEVASTRSRLNYRALHSAFGIEPGEDQVKNAESFEVNTNDTPEEQRRKKYTNRELVVLDRGAHQRSPICTTIYGGDHTWESSIHQWNREHPKQAYSLIRVLPATTAEDLKRIEQARREAEAGIRDLEQFNLRMQKERGQ